MNYVTVVGISVLTKSCEIDVSLCSGNIYIKSNAFNTLYMNTLYIYIHTFTGLRSIMYRAILNYTAYIDGVMHNIYTTLQNTFPKLI